MTEDERLDREFAYSRQHHAVYSCDDIYNPLYQCRRFRNHDGEHAAGYGSERLRWS